MSYFLISSDEDGGCIDVFDNKEDLLKNICPEESNDFLSKITESNLCYWEENSKIIIKGEIIVPVAKKVVTEIDLNEGE